MHFAQSHLNKVVFLKSDLQSNMYSIRPLIKKYLALLSLAGGLSFIQLDGGWEGKEKISYLQLKVTQFLWRIQSVQTSVPYQRYFPFTRGPPPKMGV